MIALKKIVKRTKHSREACRKFILRHGIKHEYHHTPDSRKHLQRQMFASWSEFQQARRGSKHTGDTQPTAGEPPAPTDQTPPPATDQGGQTAGNGGDLRDTEGHPKATKKGGRPGYWDHSVKWYLQARRGNPKLKLSAAVEQYAKLYPDRPRPTAGQLNNALKYRRRRKPGGV